MTEPLHWWQRGTVYEVYVRSFQDTNDDGIGDLAGVRRRLDHLQWLGVDVLWLTPIHPSPMRDFGYDVSDYRGISDEFGTLADFDALLADAHARGIRVLLDLVPNHTSDEHPWFLESRSSLSSPKRDWYIWADPRPDGGPPNNWLSNFGGSAWEFDPRTGQYYYHAFLREQPDLNWRNPQVRAAMLDVMRYWLDRGVDGFRVDVIWQMIKDESLTDNPPNPDHDPLDRPYRALLPVYTTDRPEVMDIIAEMRAVLDEYEDRMMVGEIYLPLERLVLYYGAEGKGVHLPFNFQLVQLPWDAPVIAQTIEEYERLLPAKGWPNWVLGNHDRPRIASRVGEAQARVAAMLLLTLRGTPTLYYGDEIGMRDVEVPPDRRHDPFDHDAPGRGFGRDPQRTPMQWDRSPNAGFSRARPWLPLAADHRTRNVAAQCEDPRSMLMLHRRLLAARRELPALVEGAYATYRVEDGLLAYWRGEGEGRLLVALAMRDRPKAIALAGEWEVVVSTHLDREGERVRDALTLRPDEGVVMAAR